MNEFKVGGYLVAKNQFESNELFKVERIGRSGIAYDDRWRKLHTENFRLAKLQEIKAGRRL